MQFGEETCLKARLVAKRPGRYTTYVFQDLDKTDSYVMCTRCPNWETPDVEIFQDGYLTYKFVVAGKDCWFDSTNKTFEPYQFTSNYFLNFIPTTHVLSGQVVEELRVC